MSQSIDIYMPIYSPSHSASFNDLFEIFTFCSKLDMQQHSECLVRVHQIVDTRINKSVYCIVSASMQEIIFICLGLMVKKCTAASTGVPPASPMCTRVRGLSKLLAAFNIIINILRHSIYSIFWGSWDAQKLTEVAFEIVFFATRSGGGSDCHWEIFNARPPSSATMQGFIGTSCINTPLQQYSKRKLII